MNSELFFDIFSTAAGWCGVAGTSAGLRFVLLPRAGRRGVELQILGADRGAILSPERFEDLRHRLRAYFEGKAVDFPDDLDLDRATHFQREVWQAARLIPRGETRSYTWLAGRIGRSGAARAVGQALGRNPLPVIVPCHRVLAADGGLGGFSGGLDMKRLLLDLEADNVAVGG